MLDTSNIEAIVEAIRQLSPEQRRRLQRRLRTSGLLAVEKFVTDRNRLQIAPALAMQQPGQYNDTQPSGAVSTTASPSMVAQTSPPTASSPSSGDYRSPVSGRAVVDAPNTLVADDPHAMLPLPGQAPEQPIGIIFDGGSRGNPGQGYGSYALRWPGLPQQIVQLRFGDRVTNNEAEYDTLIAALEAVLKRLLDSGASPADGRLDIRGDSLLVVNQVTNQWECKESRLQVRRDRVRELLQRFGDWRLSHHKREKSVQVLGH
jgi:ribonuclease HI